MLWERDLASSGGKPLAPRHCFGETWVALRCDTVPLASRFPRPLFPLTDCPLPFLAAWTQPEAGRRWSHRQGMAPRELSAPRAAPCPPGPRALQLSAAAGLDPGASSSSSLPSACDGLLGALGAPLPPSPFLTRGSPLAAVVGLGGARASPGLSESNYFFKNKHCTAVGPRVFHLGLCVPRGATCTDGAELSSGPQRLTEAKGNACSSLPQLEAGAWGLLAQISCLGCVFPKEQPGQGGLVAPVAGCLLGQYLGTCPAAPVPAEVLRALAAARVLCFLLELYHRYLQFNNRHKL